MARTKPKAKKIVMDCLMWAVKTSDFGDPWAVLFRERTYEKAHLFNSESLAQAWVEKLWKDERTKAVVMPVRVRINELEVA